MDQEGTPHGRAFLLMEGGPLYNLQRRVGLIKQNAPRTIRAAVVAALLTWVPLLILSWMNGRAFGHSVPVPFLRDFSIYTRFLLAVPFLLAAELILGPLIAEAATHFITSGVIAAKDYENFDNAVDSGLRLRDSIPAEIIMVFVAYLFTFLSFRQTAVHVDTWYADRISAGASLTLAGWWLVLFCTPLFQFLSLRWLWRLLLWFRFLGRMSKLDLQLFPTHPDQAGGLGFVGHTQRFFGILLFAFSIAVTGVLANEVVYDKIPLKSLAPSIVVYVVFAILLILGPLVVFAGILRKTKRRGLLQYGTLATTYTGSFQKKWIAGENPGGEALLGTGDIQSLADLGNSYSFVEHMNALPINPRILIQLALSSLLPMTPLLLTVMSPKEILKLLMKVLM